MQSEMRKDPKIDVIIGRYYHMVFKLAYARTRNRYDAEDVLQEVFLRYIRKVPDFENEAHEKAWFIRVTINCSNNLFADFSKQKRASYIENTLGMTDDEKILSEYLDRLPRKYRTVIHLFYYEDLKILDIAKILDLKESTVKMHLTRARRRLKGYMGMEAEHV